MAVTEITSSRIAAAAGNVPGIRLRRGGPARGWRHWLPFYVMLAPGLLFFIIWHYVFWFAFTWQTRPERRRLLVQTHVIAGLLYKALYVLADARLAHTAAVLVPLISPAAFQAQTAVHILLSFVFRVFPSAARQPARVRPIPAVS